MLWNLFTPVYSILIQDFFFIIVIIIIFFAFLVIIAIAGYISIFSLFFIRLKPQLHCRSAKYQLFFLSTSAELPA